MQSAEWSSQGQPDVGSTMTARMGSRGEGRELKLEVTKWDPPMSYDDRMLTPMFPLKAPRISIRARRQLHPAMSDPFEEPSFILTR